MFVPPRGAGRTNGGGGSTVPGVSGGEPAERTVEPLARAWLTIPPLASTEAVALVARIAPGLPSTTVNEVIRRAGGIPLAVEALARHAANAGGELGAGTDGLAYAVATALADLTRPARTAMAALGLLGRPAAPALLGTGVPELVDAGLAPVDDARAAPASPYVAEVAAGLPDPAERQALH